MTGHEVSVVLLAYNEGPTLREAAKELLSVLDTLPCAAELVIVDDGSTDDTRTIAAAIANADERVRVISHATNLGLGGGYRTGFTNARGTFITFFPGDLQFPAEIVADFLPRMEGHDLVLGFLPDRRTGLVGVSLSLAERLLYRVLIGPVPTFQGILMFRRSLLEKHELVSNGRGWAVLMEFVIRTVRSGARVVSVPTPVRPRRHGTSKVNNLRTITANLRELVQLRREMRRGGRR